MWNGSSTAKLVRELVIAVGMRCGVRDGIAGIAALLPEFRFFVQVWCANSVALMANGERGFLGSMARSLVVPCSRTTA